MWTCQLLHILKMANFFPLPYATSVFVLISFSLTVCVDVIILTLITIVISIVNHFISWLSHPILFVGVWKLVPLCPALLTASVTYAVTVTTPIIPTSTQAVSDLCPLSSRQRTDRWEWMVWMWQGWDHLTWSSHSPSRRERSQVKYTHLQQSVVMISVLLSSRE